MSYRPRRGRSRSPARFRPEPAFRAERQVENLKRGRDHEEIKRERWVNERGRPRGRTRSPRPRNSSVEKRERFQPPPFGQSKRGHSDERTNSKYIDFTLPNAWSRDEQHESKFSPPLRYSPVQFQDFQEEDSAQHRTRWDNDETRIQNNFPTFDKAEELHLNVVNQPPFEVVPEKEFPSSEPKKDEQESAIPEFNPETSKLTSQEWIKLIETTAEERDWKPDEKLYVLSSRLAGFARQWHLNTGINCKNWSDLKQAFFTAFPSENDYYPLLKKMMNRTKDERESLTTYFHHKVALLNACDIYGRKAVSCIVGGLTNKELKENCKWQNFDDPDLLYQFLRTYSESTDKVKNNTVEDKKLSTKKLVTNQACFYCKKKGHLVVNCELKLKHMGSSTSYSEMPKTRTNNFSRGLPHTSLYNKYITEVSVNGISLKGHIEQGSEYTTITEENAHLVKLAYSKQYKLLKGVGGQRLTVVGVADVPICVDRAIASVKLYVVSDLSQDYPVVVGQSFIEQPHVVVMKDGEKIRFYQRSDNGQANFDF